MCWHLVANKCFTSLFSHPFYQCSLTNTLFSNNNKYILLWNVSLAIQEASSVPQKDRTCGQRKRFTTLFDKTVWKLIEIYQINLIFCTFWNIVQKVWVLCCRIRIQSLYLDDKDFWRQLQNESYIDFRLSDEFDLTCYIEMCWPWASRPWLWH